MMSKAYAVASACQQIPAARPCVPNRKVRSINSRIVPVARQIFRPKPAQHLSAITGYSPRACEYWLSPTKPVAIPADAVASLLQSRFGRHFLIAIMDDAAPAWWQAALSYFGLLDVRRRQRKAQREWGDAIDADRNLRAAITRAEAVLADQNEAAKAIRNSDAFGARFDDLRAKSGVRHRAVAASEKWGR